MRGKESEIKDQRSETKDKRKEQRSKGESGERREPQELSRARVLAYPVIVKRLAWFLGGFGATLALGLLLVAGRWHASIRTFDELVAEAGTPSAIQVVTCNGREHLVVVCTTSSWRLKGGAAAHVFSREGIRLEYASDISDDGVFENRWCRTDAPRLTVEQARAWLARPADLAIVELPRPNSGAFTFEEAEARRHELHGLVRTPRVEGWRNPYGGFAVHITADDELVVYDSCDAGVATLREVGGFLATCGDPRDGNPRGVLITCEADPRRSSVLPKVSELLFRSSVQVFYVRTPAEARRVLPGRCVADWFSRWSRKTRE